MSENMSFELIPDENNVLKSKRKTKVKNEEDLINKDKKFIVDEHSNDDYSSKRGRE